jgi:hypothetical protein
VGFNVVGRFVGLNVGVLGPFVGLNVGVFDTVKKRVGE